MEEGAVRAILDTRPEPRVVQVGGVETLLTPSDTGWTEQITGPECVPPTMGLHTLSGLIDYTKANRDGLELEKCVLHVVGPAEVRLCGALTAPPYNRRATIAKAEIAPLFGHGFGFGTYYDRETFNIALQTLFVETAERAHVLALVGNLKDEQVRQTEDDGVTQTVTGRAGVVLGKDVRVPNPVKLQPYRTFREIDQPASLFVLRLAPGKEGEIPKCALFEADGGAWKLQAVAGIKKYLEDAEIADVAILA